MSLLAQAMALQAASEAIKHQEEKRKIAQFCRLNATTQRNLPHLPDDANPLSLAIGMVNAITSSESDGGGSSGTNGGAVDAGTSAGSAGDSQAQTVSGPAGSPASQGTGETAIRQSAIVPSGARTDAGTGRGDSPAGRAGDSRRPRNWAIPWIVATASSVLGAGGLGFGISNAINAGREVVQPSENVTVIEGDKVNSQYPLVDWIEENGWHLK